MMAVQIGLMILLKPSLQKNQPRCGKGYNNMTHKHHVSKVIKTVEIRCIKSIRKLQFFIKNTVPER